MKLPQEPFLPSKNSQHTLRYLSPRKWRVPQGSTIYVTLFLIAINNISEEMTFLNIPLLYLILMT